MASTTASPIITEAEVAAVNAARAALEAVAKRHGVADETSLHRLAGVAALVADNLFDVLNVASSYCHAELTKAELHGPRSTTALEAESQGGNGGQA